jgi:hypothetical protein
VKEEFVFNKILENKELFTRTELEDALSYINKEYHMFGKDAIRLDFDINKIPEVRKEVNIEQIFKIN